MNLQHISALTIQIDHVATVPDNKQQMPLRKKKRRPRHEVEILGTSRDEVEHRRSS